MAKDDEDILEVKAKPRLKSAPSGKNRNAGPYKAKRPVSAKGSKPRSAREMWLDAVKTGNGALSSGRKAGQHPGKRTPTEYWMDTLRKTGQGMSTESSRTSALTGAGKPPDPAMPFLSTSHYLRQMAGTEKTPRKSVDPTSKPRGGTPAYKSQEEYYEEILDLRKQISTLASENSMVKSKLRRTEEDNSKKEKEIERLLDPNKSEEMRRALADRRPDAGTVIQSMKQKIVRLEQQLKENEAAHKKLQSDMKATKMDEMKKQVEVLYNEVVRLQHAEPTKLKSKSPPKEPKESSAKVKALNETILRLNESNLKLQTENQSLKRDLDKRLDETLTSNDVPDGQVDNDVSIMNKKQLIGLVAKLQKKVEKLESDSLSIVSDLDQKRKDGKVEGKIGLSGSLNERIDQLDQRETELLEEREKHLDMIKKAKEDRVYYRKKCDELEKEVKRLNKELKKYGAESDILDLDKFSRVSTKHDARSKYSARLSVASDVSTRAVDEPDGVRGRDLELEKKVDEFRKQRAARVMQRSWKKKQDDQKRREADQAASLIQSTVRGHQSRKERASQLRKHLDDYSRPSSRGPLDFDGPSSSRAYDMESVATDDYSIDDDVITLQSAFRGHLGRKDGAARNRHTPSPTGGRRHTPSPTSGRKRPSSAKIRQMSELDSEGESLDDDSIVARAATPPGSRRASSTKRASSAGGRPSVFNSPRRRSPPLREVVEDEDDDDDYDIVC